jgi:hypothetical protein
MIARQKLEFVQTVDEIRENVHRFVREMAAYPELAADLVRTEY